MPRIMVLVSYASFGHNPIFSTAPAKNVAHTLLVIKIGPNKVTRFEL